MKRTIAPTTLVIAFATVFALGIAPGAQASGHEECSNKTLQGSFGYTSTGTLLPPLVPSFLSGPFAEVGRQTFDGKGNTDGTVTLSTNGNISTGVTVKGTYSVNPDCTGSEILDVTFSPGMSVTVHADFVIDKDGEEIQAIVTESGAIESRVYKKQFRRGRNES